MNTTGSFESYKMKRNIFCWPFKMESKLHFFSYRGTAKLLIGKLDNIARVVSMLFRST